MSTPNSIRVKSKNEYIIEVNDEGDTIVFDLTDFRLPAKLLNTYNNLNELTKEYETKNQSIAEREDKNINEFVTQNQMDIISLTEQYYKDARKILDEFLGKGACQKIFGDKNYMDMFDDLIEQLEPHFKKMGLNFQKMQKGLVKKYDKSQKNIMK